MIWCLLQELDGVDDFERILISNYSNTGYTKTSEVYNHIKKYDIDTKLIREKMTFKPRILPHFERYPHSAVDAVGLVEEYLMAVNIKEIQTKSDKAFEPF